MFAVAAGPASAPASLPASQPALIDQTSPASQPASMPASAASSQPGTSAAKTPVAALTPAQARYLGQMLWLEDMAYVEGGETKHRYRYFQGDTGQGTAKELSLEEFLNVSEATAVQERRTSKTQQHWLWGMLPLYSGLATGYLGIATVFTALVALFGPGAIGVTLSFLTPAALPMVVGGTVLIVAGGILAASGQILTRYVFDDEENPETYGLRGLVLQFNERLREGEGLAPQSVPNGIVQRRQ